MYRDENEEDEKRAEDLEEERGDIQEKMECDGAVEEPQPDQENEENNVEVAEKEEEEERIIEEPPPTMDDELTVPQDEQDDVATLHHDPTTDRYRTSLAFISPGRCLMSWCPSVRPSAVTVVLHMNA